jgi:hypothetical protein
MEALETLDMWLTDQKKAQFATPGVSKEHNTQLLDLVALVRGLKIRYKHDGRMRFHWNKMCASLGVSPGLVADHFFTAFDDTVVNSDLRRCEVLYVLDELMLTMEP